MNTKYIIFSDFDGTISKEDTLDKIITDLYSFEKYKQLETLLLDNKLSYKDYLYNTFNNIDYNIQNLSTNIIDEHFIDFYNWISTFNIPFYIISSGFKYIISSLLPYINKTQIFANDVMIINDRWYVKMYDEKNNLPLNKVFVINALHYDGYKTIYIGDGLSDFSVIDHVDIIFCKNGSLFHSKCIEQNIVHHVYYSFQDVLRECKLLLKL